MPNESVNYWKFATIGIVLIGATVAATLLVTGRDSKTSSPGVQTAQTDSQAPGTEEKGIAAPPPGKSAPTPSQRSTNPAQSSRNASGALPPPPPYSPPYPPQAAYPPQPAYPPQSIMEACNRYANERVSSK